MNSLLLGLIGFGILTAANSEVKRFERGAEAFLATKLAGDQIKVSVRTSLGPEVLFGDVHAVLVKASGFQADGLPIFTEPKRSRRGNLREFHVVMENFMLRNLPVTRLEASLFNSRFDLSAAVRKRELHLSQSGTGTGSVEVDEQGLAHFIVSKYKDIKRAKVRFDRDKIWVEGHGNFFMVPTDFIVVARVRASSGTTLDLAESRIMLGNRVADEATKKLILQTFNPVVDLNKDLGLFGAVQIEDLVLRDGKMKATGKVHLPVDPRTSG